VKPLPPHFGEVLPNCCSRHADAMLYGCGMANSRKLCALLASTALTIGGEASAADMALKAPAAAAPAPFTWTSCYIGAHAGVGWGRTTYSDPTTNFNLGPQGQTIGVTDHAGALGGGQVGCDYEFANNWVVGAAGDFSWADIEGQGSDPFFTGKGGSPAILQSKTDFLATATGRLGYAFDHLLIYGKGGAAWAHDKYNLQNFAILGNFCTNFAACNGSGSETAFGWTAGGGVEWAFANNWSALAEFDYYRFGTKTVTFNVPNNGGVPVPVNIGEHVEAVKVGINYRFR
jgi:outer membrane immunogenic protein